LRDKNIKNGTISTGSVPAAPRNTHNSNSNNSKIHHPAPPQPQPQPQSQPQLQPQPQPQTNDTKTSKIPKKPTSEWRKSVSAPPPEDNHSDNMSDSDSETHKSRPPSNDTEEDDEFDDGIDNATYDERMSRLSLNEVNNSRVSDSHSEENDNCENTLSSSPQINNNPSVSDSSVTPKPQSSIYQELNFDPNDLQAFADWLKLRFTDLLLDNSYDKNLPMNFSASPIPLLWKTPYVFLGNSLTTRSRFDFARHDDPEISKASPVTSTIPIQAYHNTPPGFDQHTPYQSHLAASHLRSQPHTFTNHTQPYHTQKTHI